MNRRVTESLLAALEAYAALAERAGATEDAAKLTALRARLTTEKLSSKQVEELVHGARGRAAISIERALSRLSQSSDVEELRTRFSETKKALGEALFPPKPEQFVTVQGLAGNDETTHVYGDPETGRQVAANALETIRAFCEAVFSADLDRAHSLCSTETRAWLTMKRFASALKAADERYGGPAVSYIVERIPNVFDAVAARELPKSEGNLGWPDSTPRENRRAVVGAFWFTNPEQRTGRWVMFWVAEESDGYRIAKFEQYVQ